MFKRGYAFGNWSKFVRPGFQRLNASDNPNGGVFTEAYRDGATHLAIIAINTNTTTVNQKFIVNGNTLEHAHALGDLARPERQPGGQGPRHADQRRLHLRAAGPERGHVRELGRHHRDARPDPPPGRTAGSTARQIATCELDCSAAVVPSNVSSGGVTDFTDWSNSTGKWGNTQGLYGAIYAYAGPTRPRR